MQSSKHRENFLPNLSPLLQDLPYKWALPETRLQLEIYPLLLEY